MLGVKLDFFLYRDAEIQIMAEPITCAITFCDIPSKKSIKNKFNTTLSINQKATKNELKTVVFTQKVFFY